MGVGRFSGSRAWSPAQGITLTLGIMFLLSALFSPTAQANGLNMIDGGLDEMEAVEIGQDAVSTLGLFNILLILVLKVSSMNFLHKCFAISHHKRI